MKRSIILMTLLSMTLVLSGCGKSKRRDRVDNRAGVQQPDANAPIDAQVDIRDENRLNNGNQTIAQGAPEDELLGGPEGRRRAQGGEQDRDDVIERDGEEVVQRSAPAPIEIISQRQVPICPPAVIQRQRQEIIDRRERVIEPVVVVQQREEIRREEVVVQRQEVVVQEREATVLHPETDIRQGQGGVLLQQVMPQEIAAGSLVRKLFGDTLFSSRLMTAFDLLINETMMRDTIIASRRALQTFIYGNRPLTPTEEREFQTVHLNNFNFAPVERMNLEMPANLASRQVEVNAAFQMEMRRGTAPAYQVQAPIMPGQVLRTGRTGQDPITLAFRNHFAARNQFFQSAINSRVDEASYTEFYCFESNCTDQGVIRTSLSMRLAPIGNEMDPRGSLRTLNSYEMAWARKNLTGANAYIRVREGQEATPVSQDETTLISYLRLYGPTTQVPVEGQTRPYDVRASRAQVRIEGWMDEAKQDIAMRIRLSAASGNQSFVTLAQSSLAPNVSQVILENSRFEQAGNIFQGTELRGGVQTGSMIFLAADQKVGLKILTSKFEIILYFAE